MLGRRQPSFRGYCMTRFMLILMKNLLTPVQLFRAFSMPFVIVVGSGAVFLWFFCLLIAVEPLPIVGGFLHDSILELTPLLRLLLCVWVSYTLLVYLPVAYFNSATFLTSTAKAAKNRVLSDATYGFLFRVFATPEAPALTKRLQNLIGSGVHVEPTTKWHPSSHPVLK